MVLTFDDGPSRSLEPILDILKETRVPAIFFWQSRLFYQQRPWRRIFEEGHRLGSHAHSHVNLTKLDREQQFHQIRTSKKLFEKITGEPLTLFRPPFGQYNEDTMRVLEELQLQPIMWDITSYDWEIKQKPELIVENVLNHIREGSIILLHELPQTLEVLPLLIEGIRENGYEFTLL